MVADVDVRVGVAIDCSTYRNCTVTFPNLSSSGLASSRLRFFPGGISCGDSVVSDTNNAYKLSTLPSSVDGSYVFNFQGYTLSGTYRLCMCTANCTAKENYTEPVGYLTIR